MKLKIRFDGLFDVQLDDRNYVMLDKRRAGSFCREFQLDKWQLQVALSQKKDGHNVLHFGDMNGLFMFSSYEE